MSRRRSHPSDHVHFATGPIGLLRWMGYWMVSRVSNEFRTLHRHWQTHLRPALEKRRTLLAYRARTLLHRSVDSPSSQPYRSLAEAVRRQNLIDAHD